MKGKRYSEDLIIKILKEKESGVKIKELCRKYGFCEQTYHKWQKKYGGMDLSDAKKLKALE